MPTGSAADGCDRHERGYRLSVLSFDLFIFSQISLDNITSSFYKRNVTKLLVISTCIYNNFDKFFTPFRTIDDIHPPIFVKINLSSFYDLWNSQNIRITQSCSTFTFAVSGQMG